jgi:hypothetical protein
LGRLRAKSGRQAVGIELVPKNLKDAVERWSLASTFLFGDRWAMA